MTGRDEIKDSETVRVYNWRIARETSESAYSWDIKRAKKTDIVDDGNSVEYI